MHILKKNLPDYFVALFYTNLKYNSIKLCNKKEAEPNNTFLLS